MKLSVASDLDLGTLADDRFVTWLDLAAREDAVQTARARAALVHIGEIADDHGDVWRALRAAGLEHLHDVYFQQGWYKDAYAEGAGIDLLYVANLEVTTQARGRNLDLAVVRRACETLASGCQLVVLPYANALEAAHWAQIGFEISTPGRSSGLLHLAMGVRHPQVIDRLGNGDFEVVGGCTSGPLAPVVARFGFQS